jgi:hypothetical protein
LNYLKAANDAGQLSHSLPALASSAFGRTNVHRTGRTFTEIGKDQIGTGEPESPLLRGAEDAFDMDHSIRPRLGTGIWHRWTVIIPRRSIDGGFVWGTVWRRTNRRRWLFKKFE